MSLTQSDVAHLTSLARLKLPDDQVHGLTADLHSILAHVELLAKADTTGIEPMVHPVPMLLPLRPDLAAPGEGPRGLQGSGGLRDGFVRVPRIVE